MPRSPAREGVVFPRIANGCLRCRTGIFPRPAEKIAHSSHQPSFRPERCVARNHVDNVFESVPGDSHVASLAPSGAGPRMPPQRRWSFADRKNSITEIDGRLWRRGDSPRTELRRGKVICALSKSVVVASLSCAPQACMCSWRSELERDPKRVLSQMQQRGNDAQMPPLGRVDP